MAVLFSLLSTLNGEGQPRLFRLAWFAQLNPNHAADIVAYACL